MTEVPTLVKVLAVLQYIGGGSSILFGIISIFSVGVLSMVFPSIGPFAILFGLGGIAFGILGIFIARGLWMVKNWARILSIIVYALFAVYALVMIASGVFTDIFGLIIGCLAGAYLAFNKKVKAAFKK